MKSLLMGLAVPSVLSMMDDIPTGLVVSDGEGATQYINKTARDLCSPDADVLSGEFWDRHLVTDAYGDPLPREEWPHFKALLHMETVRKVVGVRVDGRPRQWIHLISRVKEEGQPYVLTTMTDVTRVKNAQRLAEYGQRRMMALLGTSHEVTLLCTPLKEIAYVSPSTWRITGWREAEVMQGAFVDVKAQRFLDEVWDDVLFGGDGHQAALDDLVLRHADGSRRNYCVTLTNLLNEEAINSIVVSLLPS